MTGLDFTSLTVSLRSPRVAVAISSDDWVFHARRAIEFLSGVWGGAGGVIVPVESGSVEPAVMRLLRMYDPDYLTPLQVRFSDAEKLAPDQLRLVDEAGVPLTGQRKRDFIARIEENGPHLLGPLCGEAEIEPLNESLRCFLENGGSRIFAVHPDAPVPSPLVGIDAAPGTETLEYATGNAYLDLAIASRTGLVSQPGVRRIVRRSRYGDPAIAALLDKERDRDHEPFTGTRANLETVTSGWRGARPPLVVLGRAPSDFALAMLWDRIVGNAIWLPLNRSQTTWLTEIGVQIDQGNIRPDDPLLYTSTSLSGNRCRELMKEMWDRRYIRLIDESGPPWSYTNPLDLYLQQTRKDLRVVGKWDERTYVPVKIEKDRSIEMAASLPLVTPDFDVKHWIADVIRADGPMHLHSDLQQADLIAKQQNPFETFLRPTASGIAFESARWDFVSSGASKFGRFAQPRLRWPSLFTSLSVAATGSGSTIAESHAGQIARTTSQLFGGRSALMSELVGPYRLLLNALFVETTKPGPLDRDTDLPRIVFNERLLAPFDALKCVGSPHLTEHEVRTWLDSRQQTGLIQVGLALRCGVCPWQDFYRVTQVSDVFECSRCGATNPVELARWRSPIDGPTWFYALHPTAVEYFKTHGDVPALAAKAISDGGRRPVDLEFELELSRNGKRWVELDFVVLHSDRLVVGEAKLKGKLDGSNAAKRSADAEKLLRAADTLHADEVCFATADTWSGAATQAIKEAVSRSSRRTTVSLIEDVANSQGAQRQVLHHPAGP